MEAKDNVDISVNNNEDIIIDHTSPDPVIESKDTQKVVISHISPGTIRFRTGDKTTTLNTNVTQSRIVPSDIQQLTIKNLDTGEEFVIGENVPEFQFDTFGDSTTVNNNEKSSQTKIQEKREKTASWWSAIINYIYSNPKPSSSIPTTSIQKSTEKALNTETNSKSPFTKLSSFKFRKELGRGAFGRVLLAEAKSDGSLYALKIISKKNMRSSDKRQAKTERDILYAMGHTSPHPFTTGLRFAFQSENNLYLGMDYIPGGNLKELIKKIGPLPEEWVRFYAVELTMAIAHLHSLNIIYRK